MDKKYSTLGKHLIADLYDCENVALLDDEEGLRKLVADAIKISKAHLVDMNSHKYKPQGVTVTAIIEESDSSIHTYPESAYASINFYTCGIQTEPERGMELIIKTLKPKKVESYGIERGNKKDMIISQIPTKKKANPFGFSLLLDLYDCNPKKPMTDLGQAYDFLDTLPGKINMEKQAPPFIFRSDEKKYPELAGFSGWVPLIESGIQFHSIDPKKFITVDVYSCKEFSTDTVIKEIKKVYNPKDIDDQFLYRGIDFK
jgi:S-adenosylmethionine decarboxylase